MSLQLTQLVWDNMDRSQPQDKGLADNQANIQDDASDTIIEMKLFEDYLDELGVAVMSARLQRLAGGWELRLRWFVHGSRGVRVCTSAFEQAGTHWLTSRTRQHTCTYTRTRTRDFRLQVGRGQPGLRT